MLAGIPNPTRTCGYGSGQVDVSRVGSGTGTTSRGTGVHDFSRFWSENLFISACFLNAYDEAITVWHVKTVFYWEPITVYLLFSF